ncbi:MAG: FG-GAP-like repeat-containing protein [Planctomycetes bacterium]|nr:FG-GAP-like repeat-containing protein [Planctomycetota bacterium]
MGIRINNNIAALSAQASIYRSENAIADSSKRLVSGLRIGAASDDPSGLVISSQLRAQTASIRKSVENSQNGLNVVSTAEAALSEISSLLSRARESVLIAMNRGAVSSEQIEAEQRAVDRAMAAIERITRTTRFGGRNLLDGSSAFKVTPGRNYSSLERVRLREVGFMANETSKSISLYIGERAQRGVINFVEFADTRIASGGTVAVRVTGNRGSDVFHLASGTTFSQFRSILNGSIDETGVFAFGTNIESLEYGSSQFASVEVIESLSTGSLLAGTGEIIEETLIDYGADVEASMWGTRLVSRGNKVLSSRRGFDAEFDLAEGAGHQKIEFEIDSRSGMTFQIRESASERDRVQIGIPDVTLSSLGKKNVRAEVAPTMGFGDGTFTTPQSYAVGDIPYDLISADLNGDGALDLISLNSNSDFISVLNGKIENGVPTGRFAGASNVIVGVGAFVGLGPTSAGVGDFNRDNILDLAVTNYLSWDVGILLGNGTAGVPDGTFAAPTSIAAGDAPGYVKAEDFNGDGVLDLAVANLWSDDLSMLIGNGDGTFQAAVDYAVGTYPQAIASGDFDGDGNTDLAVVNATSEDISILTGNGDGTLNVAATIAAGSGPASIVAADFNGDGAIDLAVPNFYTDDVSIFDGNGDGTFQSPKSYAAGDAPGGLALGDFDSDGFLDIAAADYNSDGVAVIFGQKDGTFSAPEEFSSGDGPYSVIGADVNSDGITDLATSDWNSDTLSVLIGKGVSRGFKSTSASVKDIVFGGVFDLSRAPEKALDVIDGAIEQVSEIRSFIGSVQRNTFEANISAATVSISELMHSESQIRDVSFAEEVALQARSRVLFLAGTSLLAKANLISQSVLKLIG